MSEKRIKFTVVDLIIVLVLLAAVAVGAFQLLPARLAKDSSSVTITYTVLLQEKSEGFSNGIGSGDIVSISNKGKDSGTVTEVSASPAEKQTFDSLNGTYQYTSIPGKEDVLVTIQSKGIENETAIKTGDTLIKVGQQIPVRGKGYASTGYIMSVETETK